MPFQSEKQRRYMHANLPEIANRWERDYANGGIARLPQALTTDDTVGKQMIEMGTASGNALDNLSVDLSKGQMKALDNPTIKFNVNEMGNYDILNDAGFKAQEIEGKPATKQNIIDYYSGTYKPTASVNDPYADIKGYTADSGMFKTDATYVDDNNTGGIVNVDQVRELIENSRNQDIETTTINELPDVYSPYENYGQFFRNQPVDDVVSKSFKDHPNFMSWVNANPQMGENIKQKAREFYEGGKELYETGKEKIGTGYNWLKDAAMTGIGKAINFPIGLMSKAVSNPLSPGSKNYNPYLSGQIDYLNKHGALGGSSGPYKIRRGVLAGKNLVSGFGTNDYNKMLQKRIDYFNKFKEKRGLTIAQNKKLQDAIAEKKRADKLAAEQTTSLQQQVTQQSQANRATGEGGWGSSFGSNEGFMTDTAEMGSFAQGGLAGLWPRR